MENRKLNSLIKYFSYYTHEARIMICKGLVKINRKKANAYALAS